MKIDKLTIASELIIEAIEMKGKRPTQLNFEELIDVVESVVKKLTITDVSMRSEQLCDCVMPDPIDPWADVDKYTCQKCNNLIV